ncbi:hypothetical protein [Pseudomonas sp. CFBP 8772]|uniref:hypothetical protein n=1 Tax=Pseudomonas sp. CFBP 8772 TaxID=2775284 RepID=UPI001786AC0B|nr:hypothetical protein [Pseudomonas sp. CFBP 8772]MBD8597556.1 hypothetical protein [Pseudomonas sp. CFBP 8772]
MIEHQEVLEIEELEAQLVARGVSFDQLRRQYARFLLELLNDGRIRSISEERRLELVFFLRDSVGRVKLDVDDSIVKAQVSKLCAMERTRGTQELELSIFARCVIFCFRDGKQWAAEDSGDPTPLYLYFITLKRVLPKVRQEFVTFIRELLHPVGG